MNYFAIFSGVVLVDQITKLLVTRLLSLYETLEVIPGFFNLVYVTNPGAAFSLLADYQSPFKHYFFLAVGVAAIVGITVAVFRIRSQSPQYVLPLGCIAGGAAGNIVDRLVYGEVIDFLDFYLGGYHWPAFNIADSAICIGAGSFIVLSFIEEKKQNQSGRI
ncbi:signal peptidase II [Desulforhopalus singaporensis]|uniref:Lipoprotein signal peptidase n=1 Tax=Desulforhopalus singaporensis TaxID=91360 RepID=A0A1H0QNE8_9BACT|nr:signal peptidase II [Desulforhopalus singaporensis]SDP18279.1 signal peptidase II Aspartic peptidase. MEROPS family A08 [Desulforhopalus singaporensis]